MPQESRGSTAAQHTLALCDTIEETMVARLFSRVFWRIKYGSDREWSFQDAYNVEAHAAGIFKRQNPLKYRLYYDAVMERCEKFDFFTTLIARNRRRDFSLQRAPRQDRSYPKRRDLDWPENWQEADPYLWDDGRHLPPSPYLESPDS